MLSFVQDIALYPMGKFQAVKGNFQECQISFEVGPNVQYPPIHYTILLEHLFND